MLDQLAGLAAGAIVFGGGTLFGVIIRSVLPRRHHFEPQPELICSCDHGYGTHHPDGACMAQAKVPTKWKQPYSSATFTIATQWDYTPCPCGKYDGPLPIEAYVSRGMVVPTAEGDR